MTGDAEGGQQQGTVDKTLFRVGLLAEIIK
jgi:hypothetical protein